MFFLILRRLFTVVKKHYEETNNETYICCDCCCYVNRCARIAQGEPEIKYHIKYIDSTDETHNDLKELQYARRLINLPNIRMILTTCQSLLSKKEDNNFFKKAN